MDKKANIHPFEIEEFAGKLVGLNYDEIDADTEIIEEHLYQKYGTNLEQFHELISTLLPMIDVGKSPLTGKMTSNWSFILRNDNKSIKGYKPKL